MENKQYSIASILSLHLVPGILVAAAYGLMVRPVTDAGYPKVLALGLACLVALIPVQLGIMLYTAKKETGRYSLRSVIGFDRPIPFLLLAGLVLLTFIWAGVAFTITKPISTALTDWFSDRLPHWYMLTDDLNLVSKGALKATLASSLLLSGIIAPTVEELYFRGFLLPRMQWLGRHAALVSAVLFALYHFWSPWQVVVRIIAIAPMIYAVQRTRNVGVSIGAHCLLNIVGDAIPTLVVLLAK